MLKNYNDKFNNLDEMDKFMARHKLPKLTQGEIENEDAPQASRRKETGVCVCVPQGVYHCYYL